MFYCKLQWWTAVLLMCSIFPHPCHAQGEIHRRSSTYEWPSDPLVRQNLQQWQDQKFGVLLHWGIYSVPGIVESWSICCEDWIKRDTTMTYDQYKQWYWGQADLFRPTSFDPVQWADVMKRCGMRYMIFTTKHHDGFCLFDSHYTDYSIAHHAFKDDPRRDVLQHVLNAFRDRGFITGTYFSKPDWHSQYYWWDVFPTKGRNVNYPISQYPWRWQQFQQFTYNQIEEIMSRYGKVDILWLDGGWVCPENRQDINMPRIAEMARQHQPGLIVVDRTIHGPYENYQTPERTVPETQLDYPWESCIPLSDDWGWVPKPRWKSARHIVNTLVEIVAKGGNLVLGVGPTPDGLIEPAAVMRLDSIGHWLSQYGKAIYSTVTTPRYHDGDVWFTSSKDGKTLYAIHTCADNGAQAKTLTWHGNVPKKGSVVRIVGSGQKVTWKADGENVTLQVPSRLQNETFAMEFTVEK